MLTCNEFVYAFVWLNYSALSGSVHHPPFNFIFAIFLYLFFGPFFLSFFFFVCVCVCFFGNS